MSTGRKSTDLERLTQPDGKVTPDDETIPVLTERLTLPSLELDISLPPAPSPVAAPPPAASPPPPRVPAPPPAAPRPPAPATPAPPPRAAPEAAPAQPAAPAPALAAAPAAVPAAEGAAAAETPPASAFAVPTVAPAMPVVAAELNWPDIEKRVREVLLREMHPRLVAELDRQLRERVQPAVVRMLLATVNELRPAIESAVREVIARAVEDEIARRRSGH